MSRKSRTPLASRVIKAAEAALAAKGYVSCVNVLVGIGRLDAGAVERWRRGQIDCLERVVQTNLPRITEAMKLFRSWATERGLSASPTQYVARTPQRRTLLYGLVRQQPVRAIAERIGVSDVALAKICRRPPGGHRGPSRGWKEGGSNSSA